ncbi:hypothetical protein [Sphingopyxis sp.]|uniref:hypothetical protein n=1 Tax=Sphingopyxis sp. TaxID=1908224 RepID=UPI002600BA0D|nr:hypothetical protein [Sphingopyxis sp.]MBR2173842.1 SRPBCC family protein [Sphingopyxis sp.]
MSDTYLPVTVVNHAAIDIAVAPDTVWCLILDQFRDAKRWRELGYSIAPIDDPAAIYGGYRMYMENDSKIVDDRICMVTEIDEAERRLSLCADYLTTPGGVLVYVTYQAHPTAQGTRYTMDCHTRVGIEMPARDCDVAASIEAIKNHSDTHLADYLARTKASLEATGVAARRK